jgi:hypothetical protein
MFVALSKGVMLLSELIIIYLAVAAPFGVANFLQRPARVPHTSSLLHATGAALLWPLTLLSSRSLRRKNFGGAEPVEFTSEVSPSHELQVSSSRERQVSVSREQRTEAARRALLSSLYRTGDLAEEVAGANTEAARVAVSETLASVECYVGLALAVADADEETVRVPRETELCRISGRSGDDLHIAALCHRRRNLARLHAHQAASRLELLHALAELREVFEHTLATTTTDMHAATHPLFASLLETYARAVDLFSLFGDERAAGKVTRLLDAACAPMRRMEAQEPHAAPESLIHTDTTGNPAPEDQPCTTSIPQTNPQPQLSPTQTIRARLNWLTRWNAEAERHAFLFRNAREEEEARRMLRPTGTREAFGIFGLLLGAFVPAALFYRMFNYGFYGNGSGFAQLLFPALLSAMNVACCLMGRKMGAVFGGRIDNYERASWHWMCVCAAGAGALWGLTTGAVGGFLFFGIGSLFGAFIALPLGMIGFLLFTPLHRLMACGGMIDARHLWPLACGVALTISALILSPYL